LNIILKYLKLLFTGEYTETKSLVLSKECKATMTLLIAEILQCKTIEEVRYIIKPWVEANDLHPETVRHCENLVELEKVIGRKL